MKDDLLKLTPVTEYEAPELPTLKEVEPDVLVKVPKRWQSKAVMATAVGLLGAVALAGCGNSIGSFTPIENTGQPTTAPNVRRSNLYCQSLHHGGSSGSPIYVAHLTETDALKLIRQQFTEAGITIEETLPRPRVNVEDIHYEIGNWGEVWSEGTLFPYYVEMQLFDESTNTGIVLVKNWTWWLGSECTRNVQSSIEQRFLNEHGLSVRVLFETGENWWWMSDLWSWEDGVSNELNGEILAQLRERAEQNLLEQVDELIAQISTAN